MCSLKVKVRKNQPLIERKGLIMKCYVALVILLSSISTVGNADSICGSGYEAVTGYVDLMKVDAGESYILFQDEVNIPGYADEIIFGSQETSLQAWARPHARKILTGTRIKIRKSWRYSGDIYIALEKEGLTLKTGVENLSDLLDASYYDIALCRPVRGVEVITGSDSPRSRCES